MDVDEQPEDAQVVTFRKRNTGPKQTKKKMTVPTDAEVVTIEEGDKQANEGTESKRIEEKLNVDTVKPKSSSLLSFNDEEEATEVFQIKKKPVSRRSKMLLDLDDVTSTSTATLSGSTSGEYSKENLNKLKQLTHSTPKPAMEYDIIAGDEIEELESTTTQDKTQAVIDAARKKREMARQRNEIIPLTGKQDKGNRLIGDDDEDREDNDAPKLSFGEAGRRQTAKDRRIQVKNAMKNVDDDVDDEEMREWEQNQIVKGISSLQSMHATSQGMSAIRIKPGALQTTTGTAPPQSKTTTTAPTAMTMAEIQLRLRETLLNYHEIESNDQTHLQRVNVELQEAINNIDIVKNDVIEAERRSRCFQELKGYIRDLLLCLNEKIPMIENLQANINEVLLERAEAVIQRRQTDYKDAVDVAAGLVDIDDVIKTNERNTRIAKKNWRKNKKFKLGASTTISSTRDYDDFSTDDDDIDDDYDQNRGRTRTYKERLDSVILSSTHVFEDVANDFAEIQAIADRFQDLKFNFPNEYNSAFFTKSLREIVKPIIQVQMMNWFPLQQNCEQIELFAWFSQLLPFGGQMDDEDEAAFLIPDLLAEIVIPRLSELCEFVWDPLSSKQTHCLFDTIHHILTEFPIANRHHAQVQTLVNAIVVRLKRSIKDEVHVVKGKLMTEVSHFVLQDLKKILKIARHTVLWRDIMTANTQQDLILGCIINQCVVPMTKTLPVTSHLLELLHKIISVIPTEWVNSNSPHAQSASVAAVSMSLAAFSTLIVDLGLILKRQQQPFTSAVNILLHIGQDGLANKLQA